MIPADAPPVIRSEVDASFECVRIDAQGAPGPVAEPPPGGIEASPGYRLLCPEGYVPRRLRRLPSENLRGKRPPPESG